jgi:5-methylcytosine-specific restriction endonuclease McrA
MPVSEPGPVQKPAPAPAPVLTKPASIKPLSPRRFGLQTTISQEAHDDLQRAQALLGHQIPHGDVAQVLERALRALVVQLEKQKFAATSRPRTPRTQTSDSRAIPAVVRRAVWKRDGGRCTFVSATGHRCSRRSGLEFDHLLEVARGGTSTIGNLRLRCRPHNQFTAERTFGLDFMRHKRSRTRPQEPARAPSP